MSKPVKIITAEPPSMGEYMVSVWQHRHVLHALYIRDLKQQYVQTRLGVLWTVLKPAMITLLFTILFSYLIKIPTDNYPYALFALSGVLGWNLFSAILNNGSGIVMANISLAKRMSFPLLLLPLLSVANALTEWLISFLLMMLLMIAFAYTPPLQIIFIPLAVVVNLLLGLGLALWLNVLSIRFRDLKQIVPYLVGFAIWITPVFFPVTIIPAEYIWVANLNPVTGVLNLYRALLFGDALNVVAVGWSVLVALSVSISGVFFFLRNESDMIDYL